MRGLSPFSDWIGADDAFDEYDQFVPDHLPEPGAFLDGHDVLVDGAHVAIHRIARRRFEERGVYDATFGYNLARLNLDRRHPDAGFRYAASSPSVLRAEFTPTTAFCPQSRALTTGAYRAWNDADGDHGYDLVRVRVAPMHHASDAINDELRALERRRDGAASDVAADTGHGVDDRRV